MYQIPVRLPPFFPFPVSSSYSPFSLPPEPAYKPPGSASWTPQPGLESRNDYMLQGCLMSDHNVTCTVYSSRLFTILKKEGDTPLSYPTIDEIQANLSSLGGEGSRTTTGVSGMATGLGEASATNTESAGGRATGGMGSGGSGTAVSAPQKTGAAGKKKAGWMGVAFVAMLTGGLVS